jgi:thiol-disulfide isomerase/thioredoxin
VNCPECPGELLPETTDRVRELACNNCGLRQPLESVWPAFLEMWYRPRTAGRRLRAQAPALEAFLFAFGISVFEGIIATHSIQIAAFLPRLTAIMPWMGHPGVLIPVMVVLALLSYTLTAICLYTAASMLGAKGPFTPLWILALYVQSLLSIFAYVPYALWFMVPLWFVKAVILSAAMAGMYGIDIGLGAAVWFVGWLGELAVLFVLGLVTAFCIIGRVRQQAVMQSSPMEQLHAAANYNWALESIDGKVLNMQDLKGKVVFLNFWATWCGPCQIEMPGMQRLYDQLKGDDIAFLIVSNEEPSRVKKFLEKKGYTMPAYIRRGGDPAGFESSALPTTYIIAKDGTIVRRHIGANRWDSPEMIQLLRGLAKSGRRRGIES